MYPALNDTHLDEVKGYYELLTECAGKAAKRGGFSNLWIAITPLVGWIRDYKAGVASYETWMEVTNAASIMFDDWLRWFKGDPHEPRAEWGGLNELEYKTVLLMQDYGEWTKERIYGKEQQNDAA